jgi:beta-1,4-mannosyl-glycoprotein beta-1,4-N-acetylglucosaminyltransferase
MYYPGLKNKDVITITMIVDCFTFYNEIDVLKKRLTYLSPEVDKFVIVESTVTHRGEPKDLYYKNNKELFKEWEHKIIHIVVEDNPDSHNPWIRENYQRNCITRGLDDIPDDAFVLISDVDEIPNREYLYIPQNVKAASYHMVGFQYNFNFMNEVEPWFGTVITRKYILKHFQPQQLRELRWSVPKYKDAGWHLSSFGDEHFVANKIRHYAHCHDECNVDVNVEKYKKLIEDGFHHDGKNKLVKTTEEIMNRVPMEIKG